MDNKTTNTKNIKIIETYEYCFKVIHDAHISIDGNPYQTDRILSASDFNKAEIRLTGDQSTIIAMSRDKKTVNRELAPDPRWSIEKCFYYSKQ